MRDEPFFSAAMEALDVFCDVMWLEEGLARNTLESYRSDLVQLWDWLVAQGVTSWNSVTEAHLQQWLACLAWEKKNFSSYNSSCLVQLAALFSVFLSRTTRCCRSDAAFAVPAFDASHSQKFIRSGCRTFIDSSRAGNFTGIA